MIETQNFDDDIALSKTSRPSTSTRRRMKVTEDKLSFGLYDPGHFLCERAKFLDIPDAKRGDIQICGRGTERNISAVRQHEMLSYARAIPRLTQHRSGEIEPDSNNTRPYQFRQPPACAAPCIQNR